MNGTEAELVYDPSDAYTVHEDPFPTYRRMQDEAPLYQNPEIGFWALCRFEDVFAGLAWPTTGRRCQLRPGHADRADHGRRAPAGDDDLLRPSPSRGAPAAGEPGVHASARRRPRARRT